MSEGTDTPEMVGGITLEEMMKNPEPKIQPVVGGDFLKLDGVKAFLDEEDYKRARKAPEHIRRDIEIDLGSADQPGASLTYGDNKQRIEYVGHYNSGNGVLTYIDEKGGLFFRYPTRENTAALEAAGYQVDQDMPILLNADAFIDDPEENKRFKDLIARGRVKVVEERKQAAAARYESLSK